MYSIFTDGGARGNGKGVAAWAFQVYDPDRMFKGGKSASFPTSAGKTNNQVELLAIQYALEWLLKAKVPAIIYTDSNYACQGYNSWLQGWVARGWKTASKVAVKNQEIWREIYQLKQQLPNVRVVHVRGHQTDRSFESQGNARADLACNLAMDEREFNERF